MHNFGLSHLDTFYKYLSEYNFDIFIGLYLSDSGFIDDINEFIERLKHDDDAAYSFWPNDRSEIHAASPFHSHANQDIIHGKRLSEQSPFSIETAKQLKSTLDKNPNVIYPFIAIQLCFEIFFSGIKEEYEDQKKENPYELQRFCYNSRRAGFISELLPHYLIGLDDFPNAEYSEECYAKCLKNSFQRSAWSGIKISNERQVLSSCPLTSIIQDLWKTVYSKNSDGIYEPTGSVRNGAFPSLVANRIQELEKAEPKLIRLKL